MGEKPKALEKRIQELHDSYIAALPQKVRHLSEAWSSLKRSHWDKESIATLSSLAHYLSGSGKTFGFAAMSKSARVVEELLQEAEQCDPERRELLQEELDQLVTMLQGHAAKPDRVYTTVAGTGLACALPPHNSNRTVAILDCDTHFSHNLVNQLGYFDFAAHAFTAPSSFLESLQRLEPGTLLISIQLPGSDGIAISKEALARLTYKPRILFLSSEDDMNLRLSAVRAGGESFILKPFEVTQIIAIIDELSVCLSQDPYRVMVVEDSATMSQLFSLTLEQAGMATRIVNDPMQVISAMVDFRPELVLMDMYMPGCDGDELARVIRQHEAFLSIPIVFLSAEMNFERQLNALSTGADDFLTKPIEPSHLVLAVSTRIQRSRQLHNLMVRDGLTGLLNHTESKRQLDILLERAKRSSTPLCFAMLDIDLFKVVNDTHGHPVGDRVIKSLSHFLQQRLRKTDVIGRYGGEEFVVIFPDTDLAAGASVMDELREKFAHVEHQARHNSFQCTFSCGLASFPEVGNANRIVDMADQALYQAKEQGRNRVVVAG